MLSRVDGGERGDGTCAWAKAMAVRSWKPILRSCGSEHRCNTGLCGTQGIRTVCVRRSIFILLQQLASSVPSAASGVCSSSVVRQGEPVNEAALQQLHHEAQVAVKQKLRHYANHCGTNDESTMCGMCERRQRKPQEFTIKQCQ